MDILSYDGEREMEWGRERENENENANMVKCYSFGKLGEGYMKVLCILYFQVSYSYEFPQITSDK